MLEAAQETLRESGVDALSLRDLARRAGVSHAAPRRHFPDRQELIDALTISGFEQLHEQLRTATDAADPDFRSRLQAIADTYVNFASGDVALLELMFRRKHDSERFVQAAHPSFALMASVLAQGQAEGELQAGDLERIGTVLLATLHGIATVINGGLAPVEVLDGLVDTAVEQFVRGARP
nr:TetR/AcrR family transcriptional regulator [Kineosporia babensis]